MTQTIEKKQELSGYLLIHRAIERNLRHLEEHCQAQQNPSIEKVKKISDWWNLLWEVIESHHIHEDEIAFPHYFEREPSLKGQMDSLTADHYELDDLVVLITSCLETAQQPGDHRQGVYQQYLDTLGKFNHLMFDHLSREEVIVLTADATIFTPQEVDAIGKKVMKAASMKSMSLEGPFIFYHADPAIEKAFLKTLPLPLVWIYKYSWKGKYAKRLARYMAA